MKQSRSIVLSMRLPVESGRRLKRIAKRHGWTPSDASARLVEEGLRRFGVCLLEFSGLIGRQAGLYPRKHSRNMGSPVASSKLQRECKGSAQASKLAGSEGS